MAARRTIRAGIESGNTRAARERAAIARVKLAVQKKRDAIYDVYKPSAEPEMVARYLTVIAKRALVDSAHNTDGPWPHLARYQDYTAEFLREAPAARCCLLHLMLCRERT